MYRPIIFLVVFFISFCNVSFANDKPLNIIFPKAEIINDHTARIPFKLVDHLIVVEAQLYQKKGNFIIDTGSETLVLNKVHFNATGHEKKKEVFGINASIDNVLEKSLEEFILKNLSFKNKKSDIINLSHIEKAKKIKLLGIIGYSILKDYEVFIDLHLQQITLSKIDTRGDTLDKNLYLETIIDSIPFKLKKHTIVINGTINSVPVSLGLDSAAEFNQLNKKVHKKILKTFYRKGRLKLTGASGKTISVLAGKLHRVKLSETVYFGPMLTVITNLSYMNRAFGVNLDGILGYEFLRQKRTIINYKKRMLYFIATPLPRH